MRSSRFFRGILLLVGGTALGQVVTVAAAPFITRLYSPEDFGLLAVFASILSILMVVAAMRYELAIPLPSDETIAGELLIVSLGVVILTSTVITIVTFGAGERLIEWMNAPGLEPFLWLIPVGFLLTGLHQVFLYWAIRQRAYKQIAVTRVPRSVGTVAVQVGSGFLGLGPIGLLVGDVIGRGAGTTTLGALALRRGASSVRYTSLRRLMSAAGAYYRFPLISSGSALMNAAGVHLPAILLAAYFGPHVAGLFALAWRIIDVPTRTVGMAVSQVYMGEVTATARSDPNRLRQVFFNTLKRVFLIGGLPITVGGLISPWVFGVIFGAEWREAGVYVQLLSLYFGVRFVVLPLSQTLNVLNRQDLQFVWDAGRLALVALTLIVSARSGLTPTAAIGVFGGGMFVAYTALLFLSIREVVRVSRLAPHAPVDDGTQVTTG